MERSELNANIIFEEQMARARALLNPSFLNLEVEETDVPEPVKGVINLFCNAGVWFKLSRNFKAESCADAANKHDRGLGRRGIPLHDELKTFLGVTKGPNDEDIIVMAHSRGDQELDLENLRISLRAKTPVEKLSQFETNKLGIAYGLVNPFVGAEVIPSGKSNKIKSPFVQIFDRGILKAPTVPITMMTNAGDYTWGIEFDPRQLVSSIFRARTELIAEQPPITPARFANSKLAILTGNSPESGIALWGTINRRLRALLGQNGNFGDISMSRVSIESAPDMGLTMQLDERRGQIWELVRPIIRDILMRKPDVLTIACNTTPFFTPEIQGMITGDTTLLTTPSVSVDYLVANNINQIALIGIPYVAQLRGWSAFLGPLAEAGIEVEELMPRTLNRINELAYSVKSRGASEQGLNHLKIILRQEVQADTVMVALTEISQVLRFNKDKSGKNLIDTVDLLAEAVACRLLRKPIFGQEIDVDSDPPEVEWASNRLRGYTTENPSI